MIRWRTFRHFPVSVWFQIENCPILHLILGVVLFLGKLCEKDISGIDSWTFDLSVEDDSLLTESGKLEHEQFGQRMKKRLPTLIGGTYNPEEITVKFLKNDCS